MQSRTYFGDYLEAAGYLKTVQSSNGIQDFAHGASTTRNDGINHRRRLAWRPISFLFGSELFSN